jgi:hypothetical protein
VSGSGFHLTIVRHNGDMLHSSKRSPEWTSTEVDRLLQLAKKGERCARSQGSWTSNWFCASAGQTSRHSAPQEVRPPRLAATFILQTQKALQFSPAFECVGRLQRGNTKMAIVGKGGANLTSGADLTFATHQAKNWQSERQIQSSTRINILLVVL